MPTILIAVFALLVGYPLIQLLSVAFARADQQKLNALLKQIRSNKTYTSEDLKVLEWTADPYPSATLLLPLLAPVLVMYLAWEVLRGRVEDTSVESLERSLARETRVSSDLIQEGSSRSQIWNDPVFIEARSLASNIEFKRSPISLLLTGLIGLLLSPIVFFAYGLGTSARALLKHLVKRTIFANRLFFAGLDLGHFVPARVSRRIG